MEASMLSTLRHPNIITLRGVCMEGDHRCTVFDLAINVRVLTAETDGGLSLPALTALQT